jgi:hypothetical protein
VGAIQCCAILAVEVLKVMGKAHRRATTDEDLQQILPYSVQNLGKQGTFRSPNRLPDCLNVGRKLRTCSIKSDKLVSSHLEQLRECHLLEQTSGTGISMPTLQAARTACTQGI